jgi:hypothetical protein
VRIDEALKRGLSRAAGQFLADSRTQIAQRGPVKRIEQCIAAFDMLIKARRLNPKVSRDRGYGNSAKTIAVSERCSCGDNNVR